MPPADRPLPARGQGPVRGALGRLRGSYQAAPLPVKILIAIASIAACIPFAAVIVIWMLAFAPYAVWTGRTQWWATASATMWGIALVATQAHGHTSPHYALLALPVV